MTAITLLGEPDIKKYTSYLPLAGKKYGSVAVRVTGGSLPPTSTNGSVASTAEQDPLKVKVVGSNPITPSNNNSREDTIGVSLEGSNPSLDTKNVEVVHCVEHPMFNRKVGGSIPSFNTNGEYYH